MTRERISSTAMLGIAALGALASVYIVERRGSQATAGEIVNLPANRVVNPGGHFLGDRSARLTLVEFGDFQCPPCARMEEDLSKFVAERRSRLRFQFRHNPLPIHAFAYRASVTAEETGEGFWKTHDALYALKGRFEPKVFTQLIASAKPGTRASHDEAVRAVKRDEEDVAALKIDYTPALFVVDTKGVVRKIFDLKRVDQLLAESG